MIRPIAIALIVIVSVVIAAAILLPLPRVSSFEGLGAFEMLGWLDPIGRLGALLTIVITAVRRLARRQATGWLALFLPILLCMMTTIFYLPLAGWVHRRADRVAGSVVEPMREGRALALSIAGTLALAVVFPVITRFRQTPANARRTAQTIPMILCAILVHVYFLFLVMPATKGWFPAEWLRRDVFVPFRPCRGALLWEDDDYPRAILRIDDIWLRFADPRKGGERIWGISGGGEWTQRYLWLDHDEASTFKMRSDDPAAIHCDARPRPEPVAPAAWHGLGVR